MNWIAIAKVARILWSCSSMVAERIVRDAEYRKISAELGHDNSDKFIDQLHKISDMATWHDED